MKRVLFFLFMILVLAACNGDQPAAEGEGGEAPPAAATAVPSTIPVTASSTPADAVTETEPAAATETPSEPATPTLPPVQATQQALVAMMNANAVAHTPEPRIASDDYEAIAGRACEIVQENYVRDDFNGIDWPGLCDEYRAQAALVSDQEAFWDLMDAFIAELGDSHSRFVRPDSFAAEFNLPSEGTGRPWPGMTAWANEDAGRVLLWDVCDFGPAASAGLQRGDEVLAIDGQPVMTESGLIDRTALSRALYADDKEQVTLTVLQGPGAEAKEVTVAYGGAGGCDRWGYGLLSENPRIGYIRIRDFSGNSDSNILTLLEQLESEGALDGLVLDVRHNPGGNSDNDIGIFTEGIFGKTGPLREDRSRGIWRIRGPVEWNEETPVVLLIDQESHSAAEYFATAMQQSGRATLVGMHTAGNTEGINSFNLPDGSVIRLAWTTLTLPDDSSLEGVGVQPDVEVPLGDWGLRQQPDVQLQAAYETLSGQIE